MPKPRGPVTKDRERGGRGKGRYIPKRKVCPFCAGRAAAINYKDAPSLRRYISDRGRIEPRRRTGVCAKHQRTLCIALKRARHIALLPYTSEHIRQSSGVIPRERFNQERFNQERPNQERSNQP